jgi:hypothetical protein
VIAFAPKASVTELVAPPVDGAPLIVQVVPDASVEEPSTV